VGLCGGWWESDKGSWACRFLFAGTETQRKYAYKPAGGPVVPGGKGRWVAGKGRGGALPVDCSKRAPRPKSAPSVGRGGWGRVRNPGPDPGGGGSETRWLGTAHSRHRKGESDGKRQGDASSLHVGQRRSNILVPHYGRQGSGKIKNITLNLRTEVWGWVKNLSLLSFWGDHTT